MSVTSKLEDYNDHDVTSQRLVSFAFAGVLDRKKSGTKAYF